MDSIELIKHCAYNVHFLYQRQKTRRRLLKLDSDALRDVGISRKQAVAEGSMPFWKPGLNWGRPEINRVRPGFSLGGHPACRTTAAKKGT